MSEGLIPSPILLFSTDIGRENNKIEEKQELYSRISLWIFICFRRVTAVGCENGALNLTIVDCVSQQVISKFDKCYEGPVSSVRLFSLASHISTKDLPAQWKENGQFMPLKCSKKCGLDF